MTECRETVSLLWYIIVGADGACVEISPSSILITVIAIGIGVTLVKVFGGAVILGLGRWIEHLRGEPEEKATYGKPVGSEASNMAEARDEQSEQTVKRQVSDDGPIRSTGAWRKKRR